MIKKISQIIKYIHWLYLKSNELQQQPAIFRILEVIESKENETTFLIQVIKKSITFQSKLSEISKNQQFLECFSKKDIQTIVYYSTRDLYEPKYRLTSQRQCLDSDKFIFTVKKCSKNDTQEMTSDQISLNKKLLKAISQEDAHMVGYVTAMEQMVLEQKIFSSKK